MALVTDSEPTVTNGAELLDRLIKDIVCDQATYYPPELVVGVAATQKKSQAIRLLKSLQPAPANAPDHVKIGSLNTTFDTQPTKLHLNSNLPLPHTINNIIVPGTTPLLTMMYSNTFNLPRFIPLLSERINVVNTSTRMFFVQWISVLSSVPNLELLSYLPAFLNGLFRYLSDPNVDVRVATLKVLDGFLLEIKETVELQRSLGALNLVGKDDSSDIAVIDNNDSLEINIDFSIDDTPQQQLPSTSKPQNTLPITIDVVKEPPKVEEQHPLSAFEEKNVSQIAGAAISQSPGAIDLKNPVLEMENFEVKDSGNDVIKLPPALDDASPYVPGLGIQLDFGKMMEILVPHMNSNDEETQATAVRWINQFILLAREVILPFTNIIMKAVLPCLSLSVTPPVRNVAMDANNNLFHLIFETSTSVINGSSETMDFDLKGVIEALTQLFQNAHEETRIASVEWLLMLHRKAPQLTIGTDDAIFSTLLKALSDSSLEVVKRDLQLLSQISNTSTDNTFQQFLVQLLSLFSSDRRLLESRGSLIIRHLCLNLNPERIYRCFAEVLEKDSFQDDLEFCSVMVQNLNIILMTAPELTDTRRRLKNLDSKEGLQLFKTLYKSWCHNAVSTFTLCLLSQSYEQASNLLNIFATELEISVSFLVQVDKLVQLLESPVFTYLRLQLLEPDKYPHLLKCMFGILMLLPQSSAFVTLRNRLNSISSIVGFFANNANNVNNVTSPSSSQPPKRKPIIIGTPQTNNTGTDPPSFSIRWNDLINHFRTVQSRHERNKRDGINPPSNTSPNRASSSSRKFSKDELLVDEFIQVGIDAKGSLERRNSKLSNSPAGERAARTVVATRQGVAAGRGLLANTFSGSPSGPVVVDSKSVKKSASGGFLSSRK